MSRVCVHGHNQLPKAGIDMRALSLRVRYPHSPSLPSAPTQQQTKTDTCNTAPVSFLRSVIGTNRVGCSLTSITPTGMALAPPPPPPPSPRARESPTPPAPAPAPSP